MRFNKLDLNLLVALDALLDEASISRAAERLHMSQSAMSNALARLRDYFEDELLVQVGRRMEPTPRAEVLRDAVRDVLLRVDHSIVAQPQFVPAREQREFRFFISDYTLSVLMPHVLARAAIEAPHVRFALLPQVENPSRALERGEVDLLVLPGDYCSGEHPTQALFDERFCCVVWSGSRLAQGQLTLERYLDAGHVVMQPANVGQPAFEESFTRRHGVARRVDVRSYSFAVTPALVVGTDRIATVHTRLARLAARTLPLVVHPPPFDMPAMTQTLQWHKYRTNDPGIQWMRGLMQAAVREMDGEDSEGLGTGGQGSGNPGP
ncbi:LysR family transcriptional regulator [Ramlibacter sp. AW1]|uniref:LysR family transcriptional regulator n=1 Tax=Ramlibacter aurantiacus TaxID=2801330 RepID=A0A937D2Y3_9BURK|nr:LysR family transcriptional regulator [Ramlibacter aurantiacus]MBL0420185.1 LysR family transcriptional regulator [Ramlibacter aurantiacus]